MSVCVCVCMCVCVCVCDYIYIRYYIYLIAWINFCEHSFPAVFTWRSLGRKSFSV